MSGDAAADAAAEAKLTGLAKHFNGQTMRGRANVSSHYIKFYNIYFK